MMEVIEKKRLSKGDFHQISSTIVGATKTVPSRVAVAEGSGRRATLVLFSLSLFRCQGSR